MTRNRGGKSVKPHGVRHNLDARQAAYDAMSSDKKKGMTRPGSTNRHKQA